MIITIRAKRLLTAIAAVLALAVIGYGAAHIKVEFQAPVTAAAVSSNAAAAIEFTPAKLPADSDFKQVADNGKLQLSMDPSTGLFTVKDKISGTMYRSYPDPKYWAQEQISDTWKDNLASPFMAEYVDFSQSLKQSKTTNLFEKGAHIANLKMIPGGYSLDYVLPSTGFTIPVQVTLKDDYVEATIVRSGLKESNLGLVSIKLFPFFGAEYTDGQDGYMFVPDGSGSLIRFKSNQMNVSRNYDEPVYGRDITFPGLDNNRNKIMMPVYGMKIGSQGFLAVITGGDEYADIVANPAGVLSNYNWITAQMNFRASFLQFTTRNQDVPDSWGYVDYNKDELFGGDRTVRFYLLSGSSANYVGMAQKYRQYLMQDMGVQPLKASSPNIPLYVTLIGADREKGIVSDHYLNLTTTDQATAIVNTLSSSGIKNMSLTYTGWQPGGYSAFGNTLSVDSRIGGDSGMKAFIDNAHRLQFPVYLETEYGLNNTGGGGFNAKFDGMANLAGRNLVAGTLYSGDPPAAVSYKFAQQMLQHDLPGYKALGVDGLVDTLIGQRLFSDYNSKYGSSKLEAKQIQQSMFKSVKEQLGGMEGINSNIYELPYVNYIRDMPYHNSYDLFSDDSVPFVQIVTHGLANYSSVYANNRQEDMNDFLRDIEYGAAPSFVFTHAETKTYVNSYGLRYYNTYFPDWQTAAVQEYEKYNEALGDVQDQFIVGHSTLAPGVNETDYAGGKRIIVNYNTAPYQLGDLTVPAQSFKTIPGGAGK